MVFQNYALYPHMTVAENIGFALKLRHLPKDQIRAKVDEAAKILDLTEWLDRKPALLSGGQRQRVAMGRAIVREPSVFLMDEPLSNLDAKLRVQMRAEVQRIQRRINVATIYVTHDQVEAMTMGDRGPGRETNRSALCRRGFAACAAENPTRSARPDDMDPCAHARGLSVRNGRPSSAMGYRGPHGRRAAAGGSDRHPARAVRRASPPGPRCSSMSEKKSHRPFGKNTFFIRTAGGGTFQGTCDTATRPGRMPAGRRERTNAGQTSAPPLPALVGACPGMGRRRGRSRGSRSRYPVPRAHFPARTPTA